MQQQQQHQKQPALLLSLAVPGLLRGSTRRVQQLGVCCLKTTNTAGSSCGRIVDTLASAAF
jgi:hypothetical protein